MAKVATDTLKTKRKTKTALSLVPTADRNIVGETLRSFGQRNIKIYATATNLDRSVPDLYDGCKPVHRRILWAASQQERAFIKTARVVGDVIGKYHPHGDKSVADAIETMVNMPTPPILGKGNWGTLTDSAAAMRYTNMKLSGYGLSFFGSDYIHKEVTSFVPNYDDGDVEPVTLPAMLPNVLMNGGDGIGVGITTNVPTFTAESVVAILKRLLAGEKLVPADYAKTLKFAHKYGGVVVKSKENQKGWASMFESSVGRVQFESVIDIDRDHKTMKISDWPPGTNLEKFVTKVRAFPETQRCYNSKGSATFTIECKAAYNYAQFDKFVEKVKKATQQRRSFKINVTHREAVTVDGVTSYDTKFLALSIPDLMTQWLKLRVALELKSLAYRTRKQQAAIAHSELLIYAADRLDDGFKALKSKDPKATLMKLMKITDEQATTLLNLRFVQWSKLDQDALKLKLKEQQKFLRVLEGWAKKPRAKILTDLDELLPAILKDRAFEDTKATQVLKIA
jgi:DNA gyrase/topoisomerase IV subunit A